MTEEKNPHDMPRWVFPVALIGMLAVMTLATFFWMWRDAKPRRRPALLGSPDPVLPKNLRTNSFNPGSTDMSWTNGMVQIPPGTFQMGSPDGQPDELPLHEIAVD